MFAINGWYSRFDWWDRGWLNKLQSMVEIQGKINLMVENSDPCELNSTNRMRYNGWDSETTVLIRFLNEKTTKFKVYYYKSIYNIVLIIFWNEEITKFKVY